MNYTSHLQPTENYILTSVLESSEKIIKSSSSRISKCIFSLALILSFHSATSSAEAVTIEFRSSSSDENAISIFRRDISNNETFQLSPVEQVILGYNARGRVLEQQDGNRFRQTITEFVIEQVELIPFNFGDLDGSIRFSSSIFSEPRTGFASTRASGNFTIPVDENNREKVVVLGSRFTLNTSSYRNLNGEQVSFGPFERSTMQTSLTRRFNFKNRTISRVTASQLTSMIEFNLKFNPENLATVGLNFPDSIDLVVPEPSQIIGSLTTIILGLILKKRTRQF